MRTYCFRFIINAVTVCNLIQAIHVFRFYFLLVGACIFFCRNGTTRASITPNTAVRSLGVRAAAADPSRGRGSRMKDCR